MTMLERPALRNAKARSKVIAVLAAMSVFAFSPAIAQTEDNPLLNGSGYQPHTDSTFGDAAASERPARSATSSGRRHSAGKHATRHRAAAGRSAHRSRKASRNTHHRASARSSRHHARSTQATHRKPQASRHHRRRR